MFVDVLLIFGNNLLGLYVIFNVCSFFVESFLFLLFIVFLVLLSRMFLFSCFVFVFLNEID